MSESKRVGFKRNELHQVGIILEESLIRHGGAVTFKDGCNDVTIAERISEKLKRTISADDAKRVRHQMVGKNATEGRARAEVINAVLRAHDAMSARLGRLEARLASIEDEMTAPDEMVPQYAEAVVTPKNGHARR